MNSELDEFKSRCLKKWSGTEFNLDDRLQYFDNNFEKWLEQIPAENRNTVITLIDHLEYYSHETVNTWLKSLHEKLLELSDININNTIYAFIKSKVGKTNSSNDYWTEYKFINKINKNSCITDISLLEPEDWKEIQNIVFIDDFSGSGGTFITELQMHPNVFVNKNVFLVTINIMVQAKEEIKSHCVKNSINITFISAFQQGKAFEMEYFEDNEQAKDEIETMSQKLHISKNIFGFEESQSLVVFYNNTPNNTLAFVRLDTDIYKSIFPRYREQLPHWMTMRQKRQRRQKANYNNKAGGT